MIGNTNASLVFVVLLGFAPWVQSPPSPQAAAQPAADASTFKQEELDQMLAPIALYPDALLSQVLMASTYPLEIVEADRWAKAHKDLKGEAAATALEKEKWDPSVKSLVDFPPVLAMLSTKLDWTQKVGDAFIGQQKQVMDTVQKLRAKAKENGQLESNKDQKVEVQQQGSTQVIVIESASPSVIYVPTYDPVVVYGSWWYPAYPPYPYYPPGYAPGSVALAFTVGVAWGYAWGHCNWGHSDVDIDINRNVNFNNNIDRGKYGNNGNLKGGQGSWKHDASHRGNVPYRDTKSASQYGGRSTNDVSKARDQYRGRAESGRADLSKGSADQFKSGAAANRGGATDRGAQTRPSAGSSGARASTTPSRSNAGASSRGGAMDGVRGGGQAARAQSSRGRVSRGRR